MQYKNGNRYLCNHLRSQYRIPVCQYIPADPIDGFVTKAFFEACFPVEQEALLKAHQQKLERLRCYIQLAEAPFNKVDSNNRLVAAELEKR